MTEELLKCPFCGGKADEIEIDDEDQHLYYVECEDCCAKTDYFYYKEKAIVAWNQRADKIRELVLDFFDDWTTNPCRMCGKTHYDGDDKCVNCHIGQKIKTIREALK